MRKILLLITFILMAMHIHAVKINPIPFSVTQSDGTTIMIKGYGDENFHWYTTVDGAIVDQVGQNYYIANIDDNGNITASRQLAHEKNIRNILEKKIISNQDKELFYNHALNNIAQAKTSISSASDTINYFPHIGLPKVLVILVNFSDTTFKEKNPKLSFNQYLNGTGSPVNYGTREDRNIGSVADYFNYISNGNFRPEFDLIGPVTVSQPSSYYGKDSYNITDYNWSQLIIDACKAAKDSADFSQYDSDNDGNIDLIYVIYAGYSQSIGKNSSDFLWPKSGIIYPLTTYNGKNIRRAGISNELNYTPGFSAKNKQYYINGIGLFCHEFSHTLGLPDFYSGSASRPEMEFWDLMDGGEYTGDDVGYAPTPYTPWEKEVMGWQDIDTLKDDSAAVTLEANNAAYKILSSDTAQYAIIQNIQKTGWYAGMPGHGMLIYKVDYPYPTVNMNDKPNQASIPAMTIYPADEKLVSSYSVNNNNITYDDYLASMEGDPFPGINSITQIDSIPLNDDTVDNKTINITIKKPIYDIVENTDNGVVTFSYLKKGISTGIHNHFTFSGKTVNGDKVYSIDGIYIGKWGDVYLQPGIYIVNRKKIIIR